MNENHTLEDLKKGYDSFILIRKKMAISNRKYRLSENGAKVTKILHKRWVDSKKDDLEYQAKINKNQRDRYQARKTLKLEEKLKNNEILQNNEIIDVFEEEII
jgi:DNA-binding PadR family transcriptional regulator